MEITSRHDLGRLLDRHGLLGMPAVEVGVADGLYSGEILAWTGGQPSAPVNIPLLYLVDLWEHVDGEVAELGGMTNEQHRQWMEDTIEHLREHRARYVILRGWSYEMAHRIPDSSLGFCYIDATHVYESVLRDLHAYWPKLAEGGVMAGHDYTSESWPTVKRAVDEFAALVGSDVHLIPENNVNDTSFWFTKGAE